VVAQGLDCVALAGVGADELLEAGEGVGGVFVGNAGILEYLVIAALGQLGRQGGQVGLVFLLIVAGRAKPVGQNGAGGTVAWTQLAGVVLRQAFLVERAVVAQCRNRVLDAAAAAVAALRPELVTRHGVG